jgi:serine/threonine protein kinase
MIGTRIADRYEIEEQIGIGGMGIVYRALDTRLMRRVALKVIAPHLVQQEAARSQFLREAQALAGLMHPNIVTVFDLCDDEATQTVFIVMELLRGQSLRHFLTAADRPSFAQMALPLCRALEAAHAQGFLHRDIKPENVFVCAGGTVKLMDFGLARLLTANTRSQASLLAGTLAYMAPEQLRGDRTDFRADLYSLGILFYEYLSGVTPFEADNPGAILLKHLTEAAPPLRVHVPDLTPGLDAIVHRLLEKDPEARFPSAASLREALESLLANSPEAPASTLEARERTRSASTLKSGEPTRSQTERSTLPRATTAEIPTPLLPPLVPTRPRTASALFLQPSGKVKPAFLVGGFACFGAAALLFVGPFHRHFEPADRGDRAAVSPSKTLPALTAVPLAQQVKAAPQPPQDQTQRIEKTEKRANAELDELIKQQEQTRSEVERLEKLVTASETKRKAAEVRAATAEAESAWRTRPSERLFSPDSLLTVPGMKPFPAAPYLKMPPAQEGPGNSLPLRSPDARRRIASLRPHDPFEFRTRAVTSAPTGEIQVQVHNEKPCYVYFYQLQENKNQAFLMLPSGDRRLPANPLPDDFVGMGLHMPDPSVSSGKLLMLASVKPLIGLPVRFALPEVPTHPAGDVTGDARFALLHRYRDQIVTALQSERVQLDGKVLQQNDLIVRFLRYKPQEDGRPLPSSAAGQGKYRRNRQAPTGTVMP